MEQAKGKVGRAMLVAASCVVLIAGLRAASAVIVPILLALFIGIVVSPLYFWLQRHRIPASLAMVLLILGLGLICLFGAAALTNTLNDFGQNLPRYQERLQSQMQGLLKLMNERGLKTPNEIVADLIDSKVALKVAGGAIAAATSLLGQIVLVLLVVAFILLEAAVFPSKLKASELVKGEAGARLDQMVYSVRRYMSIKTVISLLTGVLVGVFALVCGVDYPLLMGVLAFLLNYVPNIGSIMAAVPAVLLAFIEFGLMRAIVVTAGYLVINMVTGNIIEPRYMSKGLGLSPVIVIVSLILWGWVLGPVGMLLSVPLTMVVKIALENAPETRGIAVLLGASAPESDWKESA